MTINQKKLILHKPPLTPLQTSVYKALRQIPKGKVVTYKKLAQMIGKAKAVRAVATTVGQNHEPVSTPCHRVIRSDGGVGEYTYKGKRNQAKKIALLKSEGITIKNGKIADKFIC